MFTLSFCGDAFADHPAEVRSCFNCGLPLGECDCGEDVTNFDDFDDEFGDDDEQ